MQTRSRSRTVAISRPLIVACLAVWLAVLGAHFGGAITLTIPELSSFTVVSTVVFSGLAVAYELGY